MQTPEEIAQRICGGMQMLIGIREAIEEAITAERAEVDRMKLKLQGKTFPVEIDASHAREEHELVAPSAREQLRRWDSGEGS